MYLISKFDYARVLGGVRGGFPSPPEAKISENRHKMAKICTKMAISSDISAEAKIGPKILKSVPPCNRSKSVKPPKNRSKWPKNGPPGNPVHNQGCHGLKIEIGPGYAKNRSKSVHGS